MGPSRPTVKVTARVGAPCGTPWIARRRYFSEFAGCPLFDKGPARCCNGVSLVPGACGAPEQLLDAHRKLRKFGGKCACRERAEMLVTQLEGRSMTLTGSLRFHCAHLPCCKKVFG